MSEFFGSIFWLVVTLGVLVTFHEFGHYWVARRCGVRVLRFSIGFGKPLWSFYRDGTEWAIGAIPLGGYVKFLDEAEVSGAVGPQELEGAVNRKPPWQRIAIAAAGPVFNLLFTIVAFWTMFVIGRPDYQPIIGAPKGLAAEAGLASGDRLVLIGGAKVDSMSAAMLAVTEAAALHRDLPIEAVAADGRTRAVTLALSKLPAGAPDNLAVYEKIGLVGTPPPPVIGIVDTDSPAARGGLKVGDRMLSMNGQIIADATRVSAMLGEEAAKNPRISLVVQRDGQRIPLTVTAAQLTRDGQTRWMFGIAWQERAHDAVERFGPLAAVPAAFDETWKQAASMLGMIKSMIVGEASVKNLSSVISIAEVANASAHEGLAWFLSFLAIISLSLGILNLLPIPVLDGGHIMFTLAEWIKGGPVSERTLIAGQYVGLALLVGLMSLAFYNDIARKLAQMFGS
jgi:regulator of sigma E protease